MNPTSALLEVSLIGAALLVSANTITIHNQCNYSVDIHGYGTLGNGASYTISLGGYGTNRNLVVTTSESGQAEFERANDSNQLYVDIAYVNDNPFSPSGSELVSDGHVIAQSGKSTDLPAGSSVDW